MGQNVPGYNPIHFANTNVANSIYTPSKGGYNQNECTFCGLSPYFKKFDT
jgi:hypothetical protein